MTEDQEKFLNVVEIVCARPGMYVGTQDFRSVVAFLEGYILGLSEHQTMNKHPFGGLLLLMEEAHGFSNPGWGWVRHYLHDKETDERAIRDFPEFLRAALMVPDSRIHEIFLSREKFTGKRPPPSPQTANYHD